MAQPQASVGILIVIHIQGLTSVQGLTCRPKLLQWRGGNYLETPCNSLLIMTCFLSRVIVYHNWREEHQKVEYPTFARTCLSPTGKCRRGSPTFLGACRTHFFVVFVEELED